MMHEFGNGLRVNTRRTTFRDWFTRQLRLGEMAGLRALSMTRLATNEQLGTLVECLGNEIAIRDVRYKVDHPAISRRLKGEMALGYYEGHELALIKQFLPTDLPIIELGGSLGVVACLTNRYLSDPTKHWVIEANPTLIPLLERNRALNRCEFHVLPVALGYDREVLFYLAPDHRTSRAGDQLSASEEVTVPARTLASIAAQAGFGLFGLVCDIEGGEFDLLEHELNYLVEHVPWMIVELHNFTFRGDAGVQRALNLLMSNGYSVRGGIDPCYCLVRDT
jgi:FkbM family methyltransferase